LKKRKEKDNETVSLIIENYCMLLILTIIGLTFEKIATKEIDQPWEVEIVDPTQTFERGPFTVPFHPEVCLFHNLLSICL
jgi:hypothetical protein